MTAAHALAVNQGAAGAPLVIRFTWQVTTASDDQLPAPFLGVTTTSTPPATYADFTYVEYAELLGALWDSMTETYQATWSASFNTVTRDNYTGTIFKRLDSNYSAGRFLWLANFASPPQPTDAPIWIDGPYAII
jgi:hypothetical protein